MNWIDYVIFVIVIFTTIIGLWRGFVYEIIAFIIWIAAFAIAIIYTPWLTEKLSSIIIDAQICQGLALGIILLTVLFIGMVINFLVSQSLGTTELGMTNRFAGGILGFIRSGLMISVLLLLGQMFNFNHAPAWSNAKLVPYFIKVSDALAAIVRAHEISINPLGNK